MKSVAATVLEVAGLTVAVIGSYLIAPPLGIILAGVFAFAVGFALESQS